MQLFLRCALAVLATISFLSGSGFANPVPLAFQKHSLNAESQFSACAVFDVNGDGKVDIFCGGFWYEAPTWRRHLVREVTMIRGRFDDYSNLPLDVNGDGWVDVVSVNYRSQSVYWVENPRDQGGLWETHEIDVPGPSETGILVDISGDGKMDVLPNGTNFAAWYSLNAGSTPAWTRNDLPHEIAGHGIGAGDVDGDGHVDLVTARGWWRGVPQTPVGATTLTNHDSRRWLPMHEFLLHRDASIPVLVFDVDRDGDQDLIWGRGHNVGLYWLEQQITESKRTWVRHAIDTSWSCAHSLLLVDLDGDGQRDLVAGKRYLGHDGKDPGEWQPLMIAAYRWQPESKTWHRDVLSEGGTCAMDLQAAHGDLDGDGDQDLVLAARSGLFLLENRTVSSSLSSSSSLVVSATPTKTHVETDQDATRETTGYPSEMPLLIYRDETTQEELEVQSPLAWGHRRQQIIDNMERVMGPLPTSSQRVPLNVVVESREQADGYTRYKLTFQAELGDRVPAYLLIPDGLREPTAAMLCLHPTHVLGKSQVCGLGGAPSRFYAHELARRGYVCLAPDYPSFGDYSYDFATTGTRYVSGSMKAIWNNVRALDLLESLPEVDGDRVGCIGHSLGGHNALFTAVFDLRLRVVVTSCGFTAFDSYYDGDLTGWTSARYMPRIDTEFRKEPARMPFDFHEVLAAIAPRPVFINAPMNDDNFSVAGVKKVVERVTPVYAMLGAMESLRVRYPESGHDFPDAVREEVYEWLDSSLKR